MKTKFTNSEKVSDRFFKQELDKLLEKIEEYKSDEASDVYKGTAFVYQKFYLMFLKLSEVSDNYEGLKAIIHLKQEINEYIASKQFLLDVIAEDLKRLYEYVVEEQSGLVRESCWFPLIFGSKDVQVSITSQEDFTLDAKAFNWLENNYPSSGTDYKLLLKQLTLSEKNKIKEDLFKAYVDMYRRLLKELKSAFDSKDNKKLSQAVERASICFEGEEWYETSQVIISSFLTMYFEELEKNIVCNETARKQTHMNKELATKFQNVISSHMAEKGGYQKFFNKVFWNMLANIYVYAQKPIKRKCSKKGDEFSNNFALQVKESDFDSIERTYVDKESLKEIAKMRVIYRLDFRGLDLRDVSFEGKTIIDSDFEGTGAKIDFSEENPGRVYYVRGKKVDFDDFSKCCFKGCHITGLTIERLKAIQFSEDTFGKDVWKATSVGSAAAEKDVSKLLFNKNKLSEKEFDFLLKKLGITEVKAFRTDYEWIIYLESMFPENDVFGVSEKLEMAK